MTRRILGVVVAMLLVTACDRSERKQAPERSAGPIAPSPEKVRAPAAEPDAGAIVEVGPPPPAPRLDRGIGIEHTDGRAIDHLARARTLQEAGEVAGALAEARRAVFDDPTDVTALEATARLARQTGERVIAKDALRLVAELSPSDALPLMRLARLLVDEGDSEKALAAAGEAILRDPGLAEAFHLRGRAALQLGKLADAIRDFRRATRLDPGHGYAFNNLGYSLLLAGRSADAIEPLERAAELLPNVAFVHNNLGIAYQREELEDEARIAFGRALDLDPKYVKALINSARLTRLASAGGLPIDAMPSYEPDPDIDLPVPATPSIPTWQGPRSDEVLPSGLEIVFPNVSEGVADEVDGR